MISLVSELKRHNLIHFNSHFLPRSNFPEMTTNPLWLEGLRTNASCLLTTEKYWNELHRDRIEKKMAIGTELKLVYIIFFRFYKYFQNNFMFLWLKSSKISVISRKFLPQCRFELSQVTFLGDDDCLEAAAKITLY